MGSAVAERRPRSLERRNVTAATFGTVSWRDRFLSVGNGQGQRVASHGLGIHGRDGLLRIWLLSKGLLLGLSALGAKSSMAFAVRDLRGDSLPARAIALLEPFSEPGESDLAVPQLGSLLLANDDDSTWAMEQPDRGLAPVDVLSSRSARSKGLHLALGKKRFIALRNPHTLPSKSQEHSRGHSHKRVIDFCTH